MLSRFDGLRDLQGRHDSECDSLHCPESRDLRSMLSKVDGLHKDALTDVQALRVGDERPSDTGIELDFSGRPVHISHVQEANGRAVRTLSPSGANAWDLIGCGESTRGNSLFAWAQCSESAGAPTGGDEHILAQSVATPCRPAASKCEHDGLAASLLSCWITELKGTSTALQDELVSSRHQLASVEDRATREASQNSGRIVALEERMEAVWRLLDAALLEKGQQGDRIAELERALGLFGQTGGQSADPASETGGTGTAGF